MGIRDLLLLVGLKALILMISLQNMVILGAQGLLMLMASKVFAKDDQVAKLSLMFYSLVIFVKTFVSINIRKPWEPKITLFYSDVIMVKAYLK